MNKQTSNMRLFVLTRMVCWMDMRTVKHIVLSIVFGLAPLACFSGALGSRCEKEKDCDFGLGCHDPGGSSPTFCSVACEIYECSSGECLLTEDSEYCARSCSTHADCPSDLFCMEDGNGVTGCWIDDISLRMLPNGIRVTSVEFQDDTNQDGELNPGDNNARVLVFVQNTTSNSIQDVTPWLDYWSDDVTIQDCVSGSHTFEYDCDFTDLTADEKRYAGFLDLGPGEVGAKHVIAINFGLSDTTLDEVISFRIGFSGANGETWYDTFELEVHP